ncbi:hypothetical protein VKT23_007286 [Stygiomarasmius scandens]|uniref:alpha-1,3-glucan synthase n=1 Tax=Marasmiellus scandens TaxID=2682957 RepID=A0ABR1JM45_9AGAR
MHWSTALAFLHLLLPVTQASPYREDLVDYNINTNKDAADPTKYSTSRLNTTYNPSPDNWRSLPVYTVLLDKFADGDPSNNDYFGTMFENDYRETQFRYGGDLKGLVAKLDYLQGMGIKVIYISGTPFLNMIWQADSYSPLDFTVLDPHWGTLNDWVEAIDEIHARGMYFMADFTVGTMGDLIGFEGQVLVVPQYKYSFQFRRVQCRLETSQLPAMEFHQIYGFQCKSLVANERNASCKMPSFWLDSGDPITIETNGCMASDFDQYGDMEAFGFHPDWQRQLSKFSSVQDRLREWQPHVMAKLTTFSCMLITALDIDAIRIDKALQVTVDALAQWTSSTRLCASKLGKKNFFISGEVTGGNTFGSLYLGRGRTPTMLPSGLLAAANVTSDDDQYFMRQKGLNALDGVAFHYPIYHAITRFLGMDGNITGDTDFVETWSEMLVTNDFLNAETGLLDPRHMYGSSNFDVFRWPSLSNGTQRGVLAMFIAALVLPGIPLYFYGEEQNFYSYDSTASNYIFGRQAMTSNQAWKRHGCYKLGSTLYTDMPLDKATLGCHDDWMALDHFDPTMDSRRLFSQFHYLRSVYGSLQDGFNLLQAGRRTYQIQLPGSYGIPTEMGLWSVSRSALDTVQTVGGRSRDQVWLLYTNENDTKTWNNNCKSGQWIPSPYESGVTVRNLFAPYETYTLEDSSSSVNNDGQAPWVGCLGSVTMAGYGFKAFVPEDQWVAPPPVLTKFVPGHDFRLLSDPSEPAVNISLEFNTEMDCDSVTNSITFNMSSSGRSSSLPSITNVQCEEKSSPDTGIVQGVSRTVWAWNATLTNVPDGVLTITLDNPLSLAGNSTGSKDHLLLRKGSSYNVVVFPENDYSDTALTESDGIYLFAHSAYGAEKFRYSMNFGQTWTNWTNWEDTTTVDLTLFEDTDMFWDGVHIVVQYWSAATLSTAAVVHADANYLGKLRRVPRFLARGPYNQWGFDKGLAHLMELNDNGKWELEIMTTWPTYVQLNVWGFDDYYYGDTDGDGVLDRLPPNTVAQNYLNISAPPFPHLAWSLLVDDATMTWSLEPRGQSIVSAIIYALLLFIPIVTGILSVLIFVWSFYGIKYNRFGVKAKSIPILDTSSDKSKPLKDATSMLEKIFGGGHKHTREVIGWPEDKNKRRKVLLATLEYEIFDWKLKAKIGGLGVMSSLIGKAMTDVDLIWVVPKVKDLEYPRGDPAEPIEVVVFNEPYLIEVDIHVLDNITYVILDSPVFRAQTKADPYPARMDDLNSAVFYSSWNQAIAATVRRFPTIDIYHMNDYHGTLAPIYLLPKVLPVCLSLHNAEFQGLWPLRTNEEMKEVCSAFNISKEHCVKYVQLGNTFNLLHAAASFISIHQRSIGVVGVSEKYSKRSWARYPALWTLKEVDSLPNPDVSDTEALDDNLTRAKDIQIDHVAEAARLELKRQAQEWASIKQDANSDLFVFVGRWSKQKGVDLIADVMLSLLEKHPSIQLIAVGPVIDLHGRLTVKKLARLMEMYPDQVFSRPEFTALPPYVFSGADFALIPSRDEPFGLVAVEFGRKGALGVGSRVGGLGMMPGWWYPVESSSTAHLLSQLTKAMKMALKSTEEERAILRARSAVQRFPVVEWCLRMENLHRHSIDSSRHLAGSNAWRYSNCDGGPISMTENDGWNLIRQANSLQPDWDGRNCPEIHTPDSSDQWSQIQHMPDDAEAYTPQLTSEGPGDDANLAITRDQRQVFDIRPFSSYTHVSSIVSIVERNPNSPLNKTVTSFTDANGSVAADFVQRLQNLNNKNSEHDLSIEKYLIRSEEAFFAQVRKDKLSNATSIHSSQRNSVLGTPLVYSYAPISTDERDGVLRNIHPSVTKLQYEVFGWPLYTIIIAMGNMLSATSFQITLLTGRSWQDSIQPYVLGGVFLAASVVWYSLFRWKPSTCCLSAPWIFFGLAFFLIGLPSVAPLLHPAHRAIVSVATWCYAIASAAAFLFFSLNFGEEAAAAIEKWTLRACIIQGSQQLWVAALWYWGHQWSRQKDTYITPRWICIIVWPLAIMSFAFSYLMFKGLPEYYTQIPPKAPHFLATLFRRKLVLWFFASEILRDYWLSGTYGRNWTFLWDVPIPKWHIFLLIITFFVFLWAAILLILTHSSKTHTWLLPVFAVGLGAPRWCQIFWGASSIALYLPWAGGSGPYLGLSLWLWLGVLDAIQGVGLGMILLQTLSRLHVCATLALSQIIGSMCVMIARATAPNALSPSIVFPNAATWNPGEGLSSSPMADPIFWIALICQLIVVVGYFLFYRKEQLARP